MAYNPPRKNVEYIFYVGLVSRATGQLQTNPTIAAGDFQVSTDGGAFGNLGTLPAVTPAGGKTVKITLSTSEMNGDNVVVIGSDAIGAEWDDISISIQPSISVNSDGTVLADLKQIDEQATNGNNAILKLKQLNVVNDSGDAIFIDATPGVGINIDGFGGGIQATSGGSSGLVVYSNLIDQPGAIFFGSGIGAAISAVGDSGKSINAPNDIAVSDGDLTLGAIADAAWDEAIADHLTPGSTGDKLNAAGAAGDPWGTALPGLYAPGTAGEIVGNSLDAAVSTRSTLAQADILSDATPFAGADIDAAISTRAAPGDAMTLTGAYDPAKTAAQAGDAMALTVGERNSTATALLDLTSAIESNVTLREALRLIAAATAGKLSGAATATITIRNARADDKSRIIATVDADGNRTAIVYDVS